MRTYIDLHIHSTASDGTFSPEEIVQMALEPSLTEDAPVVLALTDHDTTAGIDAFLSAAQKYPDRLTAIPGVEISSDYHGMEVHILGYHIDPHHPQLLSQLSLYRESRDMRNERILARLQKQGIDIDFTDIPVVNPGETIGRPHIARALLNHHYVSSIKEAFDLYLAEGRPCYVHRLLPTVEEAVQLIRDSGGVPVLAHLMYYKKLTLTEKEALTASLKSAGLWGIEAYYSTYTADEQNFVLYLAEKYGLHCTGGSDYHGSNKTHISLFRGMGEMWVPEWILQDLLLGNLGISYKG